MKDDLEKIITKQKDQMNFDKPNHEFVWTNIEEKLQHQNRRLSLSIFWKSAAILFIVGMFSYLLVSTLKNEQNIKDIDKYSLESISKDAYKREQILLKQIDQLTTQLEKETSDQKQYETYYNEINILNELTEEYKENIPIQGDNRKLIEALIKCYENQRTILENILYQIEQTNKLPNNYEKSNIQL